MNKRNIVSMVSIVLIALSMCISCSKVLKADEYFNNSIDTSVTTNEVDNVDSLIECEIIDVKSVIDKNLLEYAPRYYIIVKDSNNKKIFNKCIKRKLSIKSCWRYCLYQIG